MGVLKILGVASPFLVFAILLVLVGIDFLDNGILIGSYMFVYVNDGCDSGINDLVKVGPNTLVYVLNACS